MFFKVYFSAKSWFLKYKKVFTLTASSMMRKIKIKIAMPYLWHFFV